MRVLVESEDKFSLLTSTRHLLMHDLGSSIKEYSGIAGATLEIQSVAFGYWPIARAL